MKNVYLSILLSLLVAFGASAQTIVHHENFSSPTTGVWTNVTGAWILTPATDASASSLASSSKGSYARTDNGVATATKTLMLRDAISTKNLRSLFITWQQYRNPRKNNSPLTEPVKAYYSVDGGTTRHQFYTTTGTLNSQWNHVNNGNLIQLPQAALGYDNIRIDIEIVYTKGNGESNPYYAVDDVTITGELIEGYSTFSWADRPLDENPFLVSGPTSASPYAVDGVTMRWSVAMNSGVSFEVAKVDDKNFKAGTRSFTLIQNGATATAGSVVQLNLDKAVKDLSFTLFDVDLATDQFKDRINIVGYNNGVAVHLKKSKVKTTSYNEFNSTVPTALSGLISNDNTSAEGDVVITFSEPVTRVVIEYRNDSQIRNSNGRQGIAIHNLSWRNEQTLSAMPVELASFKGQLRNGQSVLSWVTAMEKDNEKFLIERSQDGKTFAKIGEVKGNGNSSKAINYTFADTKPATGFNYYRLQQVDYSGTATYSSVVAVELSGSFSGAAQSVLYPTVASDVVTIKLGKVNAGAQIQVLDATGKTVKQFAGEPVQELALPIQDLRNGVYFVRITDGVQHETLRFVKR